MSRRFGDIMMMLFSEGFVIHECVNPSDMSVDVTLCEGMEDGWVGVMRMELMFDMFERYAA